MKISPPYRGLQLSLGIAVVVVVGLGFLFWHRAETTPSPTSAPAVERPVTPTPGAPWFVDVAGPSGITFRHYDPATPMHYMQETLGSGLGWIDYNNDGWLDLFVVQDG